MKKLLLIILLLVTAVSCGGSIETEPPPRAQPSNPPSYTVRYRVGGTASEADITIENESGGSEQKTIDVPWSDTFEAEPGQFVYVSAQSQDDAERTINCEIQVNGAVLESAESRGQYVIATCSGSVGR